MKKYSQRQDKERGGSQRDAPVLLAFGAVATSRIIIKLTSIGQSPLPTACGSSTTRRVEDRRSSEFTPMNIGARGDMSVINYGNLLPEHIPRTPRKYFNGRLKEPVPCVPEVHALCTAFEKILQAVHHQTALMSLLRYIRNREGSLPAV